MIWGALKQGKILDNADSFSVSNKHVSSLVPKSYRQEEKMHASYKLQKQSWLVLMWAYLQTHRYVRPNHSHRLQRCRKSTRTPESLLQVCIAIKTRARQPYPCAFGMWPVGADQLDLYKSLKIFLWTEVANVILLFTRCEYLSKQLLKRGLLRELLWHTLKNTELACCLWNGLGQSKNLVARAILRLISLIL